jgi:hypothetical protein
MYSLLETVKAVLLSFECCFLFDQGHILAHVFYYEVHYIAYLAQYHVLIFELLFKSNRISVGNCD